MAVMTNIYVTKELMRIDIPFTEQGVDDLPGELRSQFLSSLPVLFRPSPRADWPSALPESWFEFAKRCTNGMLPADFVDDITLDLMRMVLLTDGRKPCAIIPANPAGSSGTSIWRGSCPHFRRSALDRSGTRANPRRIHQVDAQPESRYNDFRLLGGRSPEWRSGA
jgi:hypothetical protein